MITRFYRFAPWLVAIGIPLAISLIIQIRTLVYPQYDEAEYVKLALAHTKVFLSDGVIAGLKEMYWHRLWKPIFHANWAVLPMVFSGGNPLLGAMITQVIIFFALLGFTFRTAAIFLNPWMACALTLMIGLNHWLLDSSLSFGAQMSFLTLWAATVYFGLRWWSTPNYKWATWAGIFFGLASVVRPIESALIAAIPCLYLCFLAYKDQRLRKSFAWFLVVSVGLATAWFFNHLPELWKWAVSCSQSMHIKRVWGRPDHDFFAFVFGMMWTLFSWTGVALLVGAAIDFPKSARPGMTVLALACLIPLCAGGTSYNGSYWFFYNSLYTGLLGLGVIALRPDSRWRVARYSAAAVVCVLIGAKEISWAYRKAFSVPKIVDTCALSAEAVHGLISSKEKPEVSVLFYQGSATDLMRGFDRWCLELYSNERNWQTKFTNYWNGEDNETFAFILDKMRKHSDYLLVGPLGHFEGSNHSLAMPHYIYEIEKRFDDGTLSKIGLKALATYDLVSPYGRKGTALLLEVLKP